MTENRLFLISPDSQQTPSKGLQKVLEEAKADIRRRLEKYPFDLFHEELKECFESLQSIFFRNPEIFIIRFGFWLVEDPREPINIDREALSKLFETIFTTATINQLEKFFSFIVPIYLKDMERALGAHSGIMITYPEIAYEKYQLAKQGLNDLDSEVVDKEVEKASLSAFKKFRDRVEKFKSSNDISDEKIIEGLDKVASHAVDIFDAYQRGIEFEEFIQQKVQALQKQGDIFTHQPQQKEALQPPDLSEIPLYQGRRGRLRRGQPRNVTALDFLETHYGQWLSAFRAEQDSVFQDQIRTHDPKLIQGVKNQLHEEGKGRKVSDVVKTRSARKDRELENASVEDLKRKPQLAGTLYSREKRAADKAKAAPSDSVTRK